MKLVFEKTVQCGVHFDWVDPDLFEIFISDGDNCITVEMDKDGAKELLECLKESLGEEK